MSAASAQPVRDDLGQLRVLDSAAVEALPWEPRPGLEGVSHKVLWRSGDVVVGLMRFEPGASEPGHAHHAAHHHLWVVSGSATVAGEELSSGGYAYIPPGVQHATTDVGPEGCVLLFTYRPLESTGQRGEDIGAQSYV
jgi:mannose-6-phosphate isomerase-like protein (cupin superfamily)